MNSLTIKSANEIQPLKEAIEHSGQEEVATTATIALLTLSLMREARSPQLLATSPVADHFEKVCDVLSDLNTRLEAHVQSLRSICSNQPSPQHIERGL
jgi:hypothetical protein